MAVEVKLTNSDQVALIDHDDLKNVAKYKWKLEKGYAVTMLNWYEGGKRRGKTTRMHQLIINPAEGLVTDHINMDKLDNRKENLRLVTPQQNMWNKKTSRKTPSSIYKGVSYCKQTNKWKVSLTIDGKCKTLGRFREEADAAMVFDYHAKQVHGDYGCYNGDLAMGRQLSQF